MSAHAIADGSVKGPARLWYWALFSGVTLILFALLAAAHLTRPQMHRHTRHVALFGQSALGVFTLHAWVLPILNWSDRFIVTTGAVRAGLALSIFMLFCAIAMAWSGRKNRLRSRSPGRSMPGHGEAVEGNAALESLLANTSIDRPVTR